MELCAEGGGQCRGRFLDRDMMSGIDVSHIQYYQQANVHYVMGGDEGFLGKQHRDRMSGLDVSHTHNTTNRHCTLFMGCIWAK